MTPPETDVMDRPKKRPRKTSISITFSEADLEGTSQPHDDALMVTKFLGLGLKLEDLSRYDTPLVGFDGKIVTLEGQIKLPIVIEGKEVEVNFIVVNIFSPYTVILGHPWIHAIGTVPSTLHQKLKFPTEDGVAVV
ncbi:uncharacterized protein LOC112033042 [Quercus suber]|uniref:uncharacterized protein LOC112033042 n=1 Tax=Quercus suber TaxID=58331 RepID=UPI000CE1E269|nr:uncharacterized protein LOC112033042 [Quercus suber]XP_023921588.1 uncharacterized protein LOC112033043 [Quercus suber]